MLPICDYFNFLPQWNFFFHWKMSYYKIKFSIRKFYSTEKSWISLRKMQVNCFVSVWVYVKRIIWVHQRSCFGSIFDDNSVFELWRMLCDPFIVWDRTPDWTVSLRLHHRFSAGWTVTVHNGRCTHSGSPAEEGERTIKHPNHNCH